MSDSYPLMVLYGSQNGTAEGIAKDTTKALQASGINCEVSVLRRCPVESLPKLKAIVCISSTTGTGDPPDNVLKFWKAFKSEDLPSDFLKGVKYTVLGLGSTDYDNFCAMGKNLNAQFKALGAECFYESGFADDATGLEAVVDPWLEGLEDAIRKALGADVLLEADEGATTGSVSTTKTGGKANGTTDTKTTKDVEPQQQPEAKTGTEPQPKARFVLENLTFTQPGKQKEAVQPDAFPDLPDINTLRLPRLHKATYSIANQTGDDDATAVHVSDSGHSWITAELSGYRCLTSRDAVKRALEVRLELHEPTRYKPGDSFAIGCPNRPEEVNALLEALKMTDIADNPIVVSLAAKRAKALPAEFLNIHSLRSLLTSALDIRAMPKKSCLRTLAEYAKNENEQHHLLYLSSSQGTNEYSKLRSSKANLVDVLAAHPSCIVPVDIVADLLPLLQPRSYSACSAPGPFSSVQFVFNVVLPEDDKDTKGHGLCTAYWEEKCLCVFNKATGKQLNTVEELRENEERNQWYLCDLDSDHESLEKLTLQPNLPAHIHQLGTPNNLLAVYLRPPLNFNPPEDMSVPLVLVGPGTGIAPFMGFVNERKIATSISNAKGEVHVFFGCRNMDKDFLFKDEWDTMVEQGAVTKFYLACSRDEGYPYKYVQHQMLEHEDEIYRLLTEENGMLYVCGNASTMMPVMNSVIDNMIAKKQELSVADAKKLRLGWMREGKIRSELWS